MAASSTEVKKILLVGPAGSGKTTLKQILGGEVNKDGSVAPTMAFDFENFPVPADLVPDHAGESLQIWDSAGESKRQITSTWAYSNCFAFLFVVTCTDLDTSSWDKAFEDFKKNLLGSRVPIIFIANKSDLITSDDEKKVKKNIKNFLKNKKIDSSEYLLVSAWNDTNLRQILFTKIFSYAPAPIAPALRVVTESRPRGSSDDFGEYPFFNICRNTAPQPSADPTSEKKKSCLLL